MRLSDEELFAAYCMGEASAFNELYRRYAQKIARFAATMVGFSQAPDIVQTTFFKSHDRRHQFRMQHKFAPWLYGIARYACYDYLRQVKKNLRLEDNLDAQSYDENRTDNLDVEWTNQQVIHAVNQLSETLREVIALHHYSEYSLLETSKILGISHDATRARASRAYSQLRVALTPLREKNL